MRTIIKKIGAENILSITSDNGLKFAYSKVIEQYFDLKWYYCDPYSSYQREQNERLNRDIRNIPKGQSIKKVSFNDYTDITIKFTQSEGRRFRKIVLTPYIIIKKLIISISLL